MSCSRELKLCASTCELPLRVVYCDTAHSQRNSRIKQIELYGGEDLTDSQKCSLTGHASIKQWHDYARNGDCPIIKEKTAAQVGDIMAKAMDNERKKMAEEATMRAKTDTTDNIPPALNLNSLPSFNIAAPTTPSTQAPTVKPQQSMPPISSIPSLPSISPTTQAPQYPTTAPISPVPYQAPQVAYGYQQPMVMQPMMMPMQYQQPHLIQYQPQPMIMPQMQYQQPVVMSQPVQYQQPVVMQPPQQVIGAYAPYTGGITP